jgi:cytochrome c-type biogenesis protein CcmH/NrfG
MAARSKQSKQDRRKKAAAASSPPAPQLSVAPEINDTPREAASRKKAAPQAEIDRESAQTHEARGPVPSSKKASTRNRQTPAERRTVSRSALCLTAVLCVLLGVYLGTLLPAFHGAKELASSVQQSRPRQASSPVGPSAESDSRLKELEEAVRKNPQDLRAWIQLGNRHFDDERPREAIRAYERALSIKGDNPDVLTDMGIMYRQLGEFDRAMEHFTQASRINPLHEQSRFNLGVVLFDLDRKEEARKAWRALVGINPEAKTPDGVLLRTMLDELQ